MPFSAAAFISTVCSMVPLPSGFTLMSVALRMQPDPITAAITATASFAYIVTSDGVPAIIPILGRMSQEGRGKTALVTGASAGIGKAFAALLAERGYDLALTARRADRLAAVAAELSRHGTQVHVLPADLADPAAPAALCEALGRRGLAIDVLVNNAGYGVPGRYVRSSWQQQADFLQVLVVAVAELTHRLLPPMIERRWGRVVQIASLAALVPAAPGHTLYAASKAFLVKFTEALAREVAAGRRARHRGVPGLHAHRVPRRDRHPRPGQHHAALDVVRRARRGAGGLRRGDGGAPGRRDRPGQSHPGPRRQAPAGRGGAGGDAPQRRPLPQAVNAQAANGSRPLAPA